VSKPVVAVLIVLALAALPAVSHAVEGELTLGLGPGFTDLPTHGPDGQPGFGGGLYAEYRFNLWWGMTGGAYHGYQLSDRANELPGQSITSAWVGVLYNIDVATYVPFVTLGPTLYISSPALEDQEGRKVDAGARVGIGVDWRRYRTWSIGAEVDIHAFATDLGKYPVYLTSMLRVNYHLDLF
jgi:hypothetical protein